MDDPNWDTGAPETLDSAAFGHWRGEGVKAQLEFTSKCAVVLVPTGPRSKRESRGYM